MGGVSALGGPACLSPAQDRVLGQDNAGLVTQDTRITVYIIIVKIIANKTTRAQMLP